MASLTVAGQTFTVTQAGSSPCTYSINPTEQKFGFAGGNGTVAVTAGSGCAWKAQSTSSWWLSVTAGSSGFGNGTVTYSVSYNTSSSPRTAHLLVGNKYFTVTQEAYGCTYSISPTAQSVPAVGGSGIVNVTASSGCSWTAQSNANWISLNSGASGSGSGQVAYSVSVNSGSTSQLDCGE
jgi:Viral BACON domain